MSSIFASVFALSLLQVLLASDETPFEVILNCEDIYSHPSWSLLDNKHYCGTYDTTDEPEQFYTIEDPEQVEAPDDDDDYESMPDDEIQDQGYPRIEPRIQQGDRARKREFPWMAQLMWLNNSKNSPDCGGTLINNRYVLTAAHCVVKITSQSNIIRRKAEEYTIRLGTYKRVNKCDENKVCLGFQDFGVEEIVIHEEAAVIEVNDTAILDNDIALLRLKKEVEFFDGVIAPVCLPKCSMLNKLFNASKMVVPGFGEKFLQPTPEYPKVLQKFYPTVKETKNCSSPFHDLDKTICAGDVRGESGACGGDEGGPLMLLRSESSKKVYYQIGILSFGSKKCEKWALNFFQDMVFTRVAFFLDWILNNIRSNQRIPDESDYGS